MIDIYCPYCCKGLEVDHDDGFGYQENVKHQMRCRGCGKNFVFETTIVFSYDSSKADCLNDGEHDFQPTHTYPKEYTEMECINCGETRKPTKEEKLLHHIPY